MAKNGKSAWGAYAASRRLRDPSWRPARTGTFQPQQVNPDAAPEKGDGTGIVEGYKEAKKLASKS